MIGIDTNVLLRYILYDDVKQQKQAEKLINKYSNKDSTIFINNVVMCELVWVLERGYKYKKDQVVEVLKEILTTIEFAFENHEIVWLTLLTYQKISADFSDILIGKLNHNNGCKYTYTFDKGASSLNNFLLLE